MAKTESVPNNKRVASRTPAAPKRIRVVHGSTFSGLEDYAQHSVFRYAIASPIGLGMIYWHKVSTLIDGESEICVMSEVVARELNIWWKRANWEMITADSNWSDLNEVAVSVPINVHGIIIFKPTCFAKARSQQFILGCPWVSYARKCKRNMDDGSCKTTIAAVDGSEQVTFLTTFPGDKRARFSSSSGNLYALLK